MAEPREPKAPDPDEVGSVAARRPAPTLDLSATEVWEKPADPAAARSDATTQSVPSAGDPASPVHEPPTAAAETERVSEAPEARDPLPPPNPDRGGPPFAALLAAGAGGGVVTLAVLAALWAAGVLPSSSADTSASDTRIAALDARLRDLSARPAPTPPPSIDPKLVSDLASRLGRAEAVLATPRDPAASPDLKPLADQIAALGRRADDVALEAREARSRAEAIGLSMGELQAASRAAAGNQPAIETLGKRVGTLEATDRAVAEQLARREAEASELRAIKTAMAAVSLRLVVERGDPYAAELAAARTQTGSGALAPLEPFATAGVPTVAALSRELSALVPAMQKVAGAPERPAGFLARLQANAEKIVSVKAVDAPAGDDTAAVLARIDARAQQNDLPAALAELAKLPPDVRAPAQGWIARAEGRSRALAAVRQTAGEALAALRPAQ